MNCILTIEFIYFMNSKKVNADVDYERSLEARHRMLALKNSDFEILIIIVQSKTCLDTYLGMYLNFELRSQYFKKRDFLSDFQTQ